MCSGVQQRGPLARPDPAKTEKGAPLSGDGFVQLSGLGALSLNRGFQTKQGGI